MGRRATVHNRIPLLPPPPPSNVWRFIPLPVNDRQNRKHTADVLQRLSRRRLSRAGRVWQLSHACSTPSSRSSPINGELGTKHEEWAGVVLIRAWPHLNNSYNTSRPRLVSALRFCLRADQGSLSIHKLHRKMQRCGFPII